MVLHRMFESGVRQEALPVRVTLLPEVFSLLCDSLVYQVMPSLSCRGKLWMSLSHVCLFLLRPPEGLLGPAQGGGVGGE